MTYSSNVLRITARVVVLAFLMIAAVVSYYETDLVVTPLMLTLLAIISAVELIWYLGRIEREFTRFLLSIKHQDFSREKSITCNGAPPSPCKITIRSIAFSSSLTFPGQVCLRIAAISLCKSLKLLSYL